MQMAADNIWLIRAPGCLDPRGAGGAHWALPAPGDGWLTSVGPSQRCSWVHSPPASQPSNLSLTQDGLITVTRLSLRACSAALGGKACSSSSLANLSVCALPLPTPKIWLAAAWIWGPVSPLPVLAGWPWTCYSTSLSISFLCSKKGANNPYL